MSRERIVHANGVELCVETFGDANDPAMLLIGGAASSLDWWEDDFCTRLAAGLRFVIRYDHRDTGRSTTYEAGAPPYGLPDLAADAIALLDALGVKHAHLVGMSMGGMIAMRLALDHAERVDSLTLISTSPGGAGSADLPPIAKKLEAHFAREKPPRDWNNRAAVIDHIVDGLRAFTGRRGFDERHARQLAGRIFDRTKDMAASMMNHTLMDGGDPIRTRLAEVDAPTLIMHGTDDPLFPYGHAQALASEIEGARLLALDGVGHEMPPAALWDVAIAAILLHTSGSWEEQGSRLASKSLAAGKPTEWFEQLYAAAASGEVAMPWDRLSPHPLFVEWARAHRIVGSSDKRAIVVGCGLGADAEYVASLGFDTTAFDISATAVRLARQRFPQSTVQYVTADLLDLPREWPDAFDLVVEIITVQALPQPQRNRAIVNVGRLVKPGGTLLVIAAAHDEAAVVDGPPWPLARSEIDSFAESGLTAVQVACLLDEKQPDYRRWRAEFRRPQVRARSA